MPETIKLPTELSYSRIKTTRVLWTHPICVLWTLSTSVHLGATRVSLQCSLFLFDVYPLISV